MSAAPRTGREAGPEWFQDTGFWTDYAQIMFDEDRWAEVPAVVDAIEALAEPPRGGAVLDACCGPGRHSLEFAARGYRVTGIDITEPYLDAARASALAWGVEAGDGAGTGRAEFLRADVRRFRGARRFDLAVNLYTSFGYFRDPADDVAALRALRRSLAPGGALVLEMNGKETAVRDFVRCEEYERGGWSVRTENEVVGAWEGLRSRWILTRPGERVDRAFALRLYSATELLGALAEAGFAEARAYGGLDGSAYDQDARSLVALARVGGRKA